jgi:hypothetical protein
MVEAITSLWPQAEEAMMTTTSRAVGSDALVVFI